MKHYHVHVYFTDVLLQEAQQLAELAVRSGHFHFAKIHPAPVGPHPTGMVEAHFSENVYPRVVEWVEAHRGVFSALIHDDTGDDFADHTVGSRWLGQAVPLKFEFFELVKKNPDARLHSLIPSVIP